MNTTILNLRRPTAPLAAPPRTVLSRPRDTRTVLRLLETLLAGRLELRLPDGSVQHFGHHGEASVLRVHDEALFSRVLTRGDIGLAEAYLDGLWDSPNLVTLLRLLADNRDSLKQAVYGAWPALLAARLRHWLNRNSHTGSRRNIMAHYDLGNDFYRLWLDETMSYSAALFGSKAFTLEEAQRAKYRRILNQLNAAPGQQVLEIGCGWGGFAEMAVADGLAITGLTLSPAQREYARRRVASADFLLRDYRDTVSQYDHIVSIEMFEAVGERWWPTYFETVARTLKPGGRAVIQTITIRDDLFADYRRGTDFIQQYIFPGGMLPSKSVFRRHAMQAGLQLDDEFAFGKDYAVTLGDWRQAFEARWPEIAALGFDETFHRLWHFYLAYCEAAFLAGNVDVVQFTLSRPA